MMNSQRGIVFKTTAKYSIFLTPDGQFQKGIPNSNRVQVGEELNFQPYKKVKTSFMSFNSAWSAPIIAVAATLVLLFSVLLPAQSSVSAFVQVDINPSVELGIDQKGNVYVFNGLNEEGRTIKRDITFWKGKPLSWVLLNIVDRTENILEETESIEITTIYQEEVNHDALAKVIEKAVASSTSKVLGTKQEVQVLEASLEERDAARNEGLSVRKYHAELEVKKEEKEQPLKEKDKVVPPIKKDIPKKQNQPPVQKKDGSETKDTKKENNHQRQTDQKQQKSQPNHAPKVEPSQKNKDNRTKENSKQGTNQKSDSATHKNNQKRDTQKSQEKNSQDSSKSRYNPSPKANNDYQQKYKKNDEKNDDKHRYENKKDENKKHGQGNHQSQNGQDNNDDDDDDKGNERNHKKSNDRD